MIFKIALVLLALALLAGMIGKAGRRPVDRTKAKPIEAARKCPVCGVYVLGESASCGNRDCPQA
jgi:hypothetical protein